MKIAMIGAGYVGLVSGACFADFGHAVTCVDNDSSKVDALRNGDIPIYEPGLQELVEKNVTGDRLRFTTDLGAAVADADAVFIAVGTPSRSGDGLADLSFVFQVAREIAAAAKDFCVVVTKSTVPVGTGDKVERVMAEKNPDGEFTVVSNPEFLREGAAIDDFRRPDRVVIGTSNERAKDIMRKIYDPLDLDDHCMVFTDRRTSEMIKYASNAFLATKITFINEVADLCEKVGANVQEVARGIGLDKRIGSQFLNAGPGYGGSCFPKDTMALIKTAQDNEAPIRLIETVTAVNEQRKRAMGRKVIQACGGSVDGKTIGLLGLTFKPNTDDMRYAPSLSIVAALEDGNAKVRAFDPEGMEQAAELLRDVEYCEDIYACAKDVDALVIVTEWDEFRALDFERLKDPDEITDPCRSAQYLRRPGRHVARLQIRRRRCWHW